MQIEIPQELADTIASRFAGLSVEEYVVRTVRESIHETIDGREAEFAPGLAAPGDGDEGQGGRTGGRTIPLP